MNGRRRAESPSVTALLTPVDGTRLPRDPRRSLDRINARPEPTAAPVPHTIALGVDEVYEIPAGHYDHDHRRFIADPALVAEAAAADDFQRRWRAAAERAETAERRADTAARAHADAEERAERMENRCARLLARRANDDAEAAACIEQRTGRTGRPAARVPAPWLIESRDPTPDEWATWLRTMPAWQATEVAESIMESLDRLDAADDRADEATDRARDAEERLEGAHQRTRKHKARAKRWRARALAAEAERDALAAADLPWIETPTENPVTPPYRVGDRVRATVSDFAPRGSTGTVTHASPLTTVAWDHDPDGDGSGSWSALDWTIEHLPPAEDPQLRDTGARPATPTAATDTPLRPGDRVALVRPPAGHGGYATVAETMGGGGIVDAVRLDYLPGWTRVTDVALVARPAAPTSAPDPEPAPAPEPEPGKRARTGRPDRASRAPHMGTPIAFPTALGTPPPGWTVQRTRRLADGAARREPVSRTYWIGKGPQGDAIAARLGGRK